METIGVLVMAVCIVGALCAPRKPSVRKCPACKGKVSTRAAACPHCGDSE